MDVSNIANECANGDFFYLKKFNNKLDKKKPLALRKRFSSSGDLIIGQQRKLRC
jgi:hypothetical protein